MQKPKISNKRLKMKVLDRWENEGGRLSDEEIRTTENEIPSVGEDRTANEEHTSSDQERERSIG